MIAKCLGMDRARRGSRLVMGAPWAVTCSCGWVAVAETWNEAVALVETHSQQRQALTAHTVAIRGAEAPWKRLRPSSRNAPI
jgi:hypothetical protein